MPNFFDAFKAKINSKKVLPIIFVVDTSGSMVGGRISHLNKAINTVVERFVNYNSDSASEFNIKIAILKFSTGCQWITDGLIDPDKYLFSEISCGGMTELGCALKELEHKLSRKELFTGTQSFAAPFICFISDGEPTDNYEGSLKQLNENRWYKVAKKVAVSVGEGFDDTVLSNLVGSSEAVIHLNSELFLEQIIIGLCSSLSVSASITASTLTSPIKPVRPVNPTTFDSDHVCSSRMASQRREFDSDHFGETCVLQPTEFDNKSNTTTFSSIDDSSWGDSDWDDWDDAPATLPKLNSADDRRKKLAEALRRGEPVNFAISGSANNSSSIGIKVPDGELAGGGIACSSCGNLVMMGHKFCPECGMPVQSSMKSKVNVSQVQFSAVVPKQFTKGEYSMIDISVYEEMYRNVVDRIIANADNETKEVIASSQEIVDNTMIRIKLSSPDIELDDRDETQKWQGKYLTFSFPVEIPNNYAKKQALFIANVYFNDVIATKLKFIANCSSTREQKIQMTREDVLTAFISYASQDRSRVATIIQGMKKARPDMDIFFDVESLRSGEDWANALQCEIEKRDILFLCWSKFARNSEWVEKEWRYALSNKGIDAIEPIPLVSPAECPPPDELKSKHFNDRALLYQEV